MKAIRLIERAAGSKLILDLPVSLQRKQIEVIVLELPTEERATEALALRRQPPVALTGKMTLHDDLMAPAVPETDWDAQ